MATSVPPPPITPAAPFVPKPVAPSDIPKSQVRALGGMASRMSMGWGIVTVTAFVLGLLGAAAFGLSIYNTNSIQNVINPSVFSLIEFEQNQTTKNQLVYTNITYLSTTSIFTINGQGGTGNNIDIISTTPGIVVSGSSNTVSLTLNTSSFAGGVTTVSGGSTGLSPSTPTVGNVVLGGTVNAPSGGTGLNTYATGDILYAASINPSALTRLPAGAAGSFLSIVPGGTPGWETNIVTTFHTTLQGLSPQTSAIGNVALTGTLGPTSGGTGITNYSTGDLIYANGPNSLALIPPGQNGQVLTMASGIPAWYNISMTGSSSNVSSFSGGSTGLTPASPTTGNIILGGTLNALNGGTGQSTYAKGDILYAASSNPSSLTQLAAGAAGSFLSIVPGGTPGWETNIVNAFHTTLQGLSPQTSTNGNVALTGTLGPTSGGTGLTNYTTGDLLYANGTNSLGLITPGTNGQVLTMVGGVPAWYWYNTSGGGVISFSTGSTGLTPLSATTGAVTLGGTLNAVSGGTGQSSYSTGDTLYASGSTTVSKLALGSGGSFMGAANSTNIPTWFQTQGNTYTSPTLYSSTSPGGFTLDFIHSVDISVGPLHFMQVNIAFTTSSSSYLAVNCYYLSSMVNSYTSLLFGLGGGGNYVSQVFPQVSGGNFCNVYAYIIPGPDRFCFSVTFCTSTSTSYTGTFTMPVLLSTP